MKGNSEENAHFENEDKTLNQLMLLENEFREHNTLMKNEMQLQKELVDKLWTLSQRYIYLESSRPSCCYLDMHTGSAEDAILQEFTDKLKQIRNSNSCRATNSIAKLRKSCLAFDNLCTQLDMTIESALIIGDAFHKPISYFIELVNDLFKYFHAWILKLKYSAQQFDPLKIDSIEQYKKHIEISEDFEEYLNVGLIYCKCLRPKPKC